MGSIEVLALGLLAIGEERGGRGRKRVKGNTYDIGKDGEVGRASVTNAGTLER